MPRAKNKTTKKSTKTDKNVDLLEELDTLKQKWVQTTTKIYDLKAGSGMNGTVGIATLASGHAEFPAPGWTPDNGGAWYLGSDSSIADGNYTGQMIEMPLISLGNDNYTINDWVKLKNYSANSDGHSYLVSNQFGSPVTTHCHIKRVGNTGRIGFGA